MKKNSAYILILLQVFFLQSCLTSPSKGEPFREHPEKEKVQKIEVRKDPPPPTLEDLTIVRNVEDGRPYQLSKICGKLPVFVEISATWCDACKELYPVTEKLRNMFEGKVCFVRIVIDEKPFEGDSEIQTVYPVSSPLVLSFSRSEALPRVVILNKDDKEPYADLTGKYPFLYYYGVLSEL